MDQPHQQAVQLLKSAKEGILIIRRNHKVAEEVKDKFTEEVKDEVTEEVTEEVRNSVSDWVSVYVAAGRLGCLKCVCLVPCSSLRAHLQQSLLLRLPQRSPRQSPWTLPSHAKLACNVGLS